MNYFFFLGRVHELAHAELEAVLPRFTNDFTLSNVNDSLVSVSCENLDTKALMLSLGGTVKIAEELVVFSHKDDVSDAFLEEQTAKFIEQYAKNGSKKVVFSLNASALPELVQPSENRVKDLLKEKGFSSRFIDSKKSGLGAAHLLHHSIIELTYIMLDGDVHVLRTVEIQDIDMWSKRDFGKPYRDPKKGMLPPKVARSMVNLAIGSRSPSDLVVFDPFCGSGTVLMEAAVLGTKRVIGTDIDSSAIYGAAENMKWFSQEFNMTVDYALSIQDATQLSLKETKEKVDCVVTEPFLGKPNPREKDAENTLKGVEKLYIGVLKVLKNLLKPHGVIVIILPVLVFENRVKTLNNLIDRLDSLGYTREKGPFRYSRPQAIVQRDIIVLRMKE